VNHRRRQGKRRTGTGRRRGEARRLKWLALFAVVAASGLVAALVAFFALGAGSDELSGPPRAVIVDQLDLTFPDPAFRQEATALLEQAGYAVDYFPGEQVTVDLFRHLPDQGYKYVILRVHSTAVLREEGQAASTDKPVFFTGQPYTRTEYLDEQRGKYLAGVHYSEDDPDYHFGITPEFISKRAKGDFDGATVILMGCDALTSDVAAAAFVDRGAKEVIGWNGWVSADHTDAATERLLRYLLVEKRTPSEAVARAMADVGPDPSYGSKLVLYPAEAAASGAP
jgi:hypothetical protein